MPMHSNYNAEEFRLDLIFSGNLDVSVSQDICAICNSVPVGLRSCIVDVCGTDQIFDSGVALLKMLHRRLVENEIIVVILSSSPEIRERMLAIASRPAPFVSFRSRIPSKIPRSAKPARNRL